MDWKENYAKLLVRSGINIQKDQTLVIKSSIENAEFALQCAKVAYDAGAKRVVMNWEYEELKRLTYEKAPRETFETVPEWSKHFYNDYANEDAAFLVLEASDPEAYKGIDPSLMNLVRQVSTESYKDYYDKAMSNRISWCVSAVPSKKWAAKVFPDMSVEEAYEALWNAILKATRADQEDPVEAWAKHQNRLDQEIAFMHKHRFKYLKYKNSLGTDLTVELIPDHLWIGGGDLHVDKGYKFISNMPTEEIFSMPKADGVNGKVYASYPLAYGGSVIKDFWFEFKDGSIVDFGAEEGYDLLKGLVETDEGSRRLGEVALVPYDSPISNLDILFYQTLYDENASCHFAIGRAYPINIKGGDKMTQEELNERGSNYSNTHVDFMIGTSDLEIIGVKEDGSELPVFSKGNFAFDIK